MLCRQDKSPLLRYVYIGRENKKAANLAHVNWRDKSCAFAGAERRVYIYFVPAASFCTVGYISRASYVLGAWLIDLAVYFFGKSLRGGKQFARSYYALLEAICIRYYRVPPRKKKAINFSSLRDSILPIYYIRSRERIYNLFINYARNVYNNPTAQMRAFNNPAYKISMQT